MYGHSVSIIPGDIVVSMSNVDFQKAIDGLGDNTTTLFEDWQLDYLMAQHDGHFKHDCSKYNSKCPISIFETSLG